MRLAFAILLTIPGLIHALGFAKAFELAEFQFASAARRTLHRAKLGSKVNAAWRRARVSGNVALIALSGARVTAQCSLVRQLAIAHTSLSRPEAYLCSRLEISV
jgi:hypothetical protein